MWLNDLSKRGLSWLTTGRAVRPQTPRRPSLRLSVEQLEDRMVPTNFTAATVSDLIADINAANRAHGANTITLTAPTTSPYVLTAVDNTTDGPTGLPVIAANDNLTILGNSDVIERSTVAGTPAFRLLDVAGGGSLTLENLTLQNGYAFGSGVWAEGGAILNKGTLTLHDVTVQGNSAQGSAGVPKNNVAGTGQDATGGGIYSSGALTLEGGTLIQNNQALGGIGGTDVSGKHPGGTGGRAFGGGIYVAGGMVSASNVTLSSNTAQGGNGGNGDGWIDIYFTAWGSGGAGEGGGIYVAGGTVTLSSDTLSYNTAEGGYPGSGTNNGFNKNVGNAFGGGLYAAGGTISLFNDTVSFNQARGNIDYPSAQGEGGGLYILPRAAFSLDAFTLAHVINNFATTSNNDIFGSYTVVP